VQCDVPACAIRVCCWILVVAEDGWADWSKRFVIVVPWLWPLSIGGNPGIATKQWPWVLFLVKTTSQKKGLGSGVLEICATKRGSGVKTGQPKWQFGGVTRPLKSRPGMSGRQCCWSAIFSAACSWSNSFCNAVRLAPKASQSHRNLASSSLCPAEFPTLLVVCTESGLHDHDLSASNPWKEPRCSRLVAHRARQ